jgi:hypothetical protein
MCGEDLVQPAHEELEVNIFKRAKVMDKISSRFYSLDEILVKLNVELALGITNLG